MSEALFNLGEVKPLLVSRRERSRCAINIRTLEHATRWLLSCKTSELVKTSNMIDIFCCLNKVAVENVRVEVTCWGGKLKATVRCPKG
jgi:hypothetical protein